MSPVGQQGCHAREVGKGSLKYIFCGSSAPFPFPSCSHCFSLFFSIEKQTHQCPEHTCTIPGWLLCSKTAWLQALLQLFPSSCMNSAFATVTGKWLGSRKLEVMKSTVFKAISFTTDFLLYFSLRHLAL